MEDNCRVVQAQNKLRSQRPKWFLHTQGKRIRNWKITSGFSFEKLPMGLLLMGSHYWGTLSDLISQYVLILKCKIIITKLTKVI